MGLGDFDPTSLLRREELAEQALCLEGQEAISAARRERFFQVAQGCVLVGPETSQAEQMRRLPEFRRHSRFLPIEGHY
jgi:hypothetical protein